MTERQSQTTTTRCVPPDPDRDGYHWVRRWRGINPIPLMWNSRWHANGAEGWGQWAQPDREHEWEYLGPIPFPEGAA